MTSFVVIVFSSFVVVVTSFSQPIMKRGAVTDDGVADDKRLLLLVLLPIVISGILSIFLLSNDTADGDGGDRITIFRRDFLCDDADKDNDVAESTLSAVVEEGSEIGRAHV